MKSPRRVECAAVRDSPGSFPPPSTFGFPEKFRKWRPDQEQALRHYLAADCRVLAPVLPTGSGKSLFYLALALLTPGVKRAAFLTATKGLQDQLAGDFLEIGLSDVRGQNAYPCLAMEPTGEFAQYGTEARRGTCEEGPCHSGHRCSLKEAGCLHYDAVRAARGATLVSTNYAFWMAAGAYAEGLGDFDLLVLDEAHDAPDQLSSFLAIDLTGWDAEIAGARLLGGTDLGAWKSWGWEVSTRLQASLEGHPLPTTPGAMRHYRDLKRVHRSLQRLAGISPIEWVVEQLENKKWRFECLEPGQYTEKFLFRGTPKLLLTSATLRPKTLSLLGLEPAQSLFCEVPSSFALSRRPITHINTVRVDFRSWQQSENPRTWRTRIDQVVSRRLDRKGIIHTMSYKRMNEILQHSEYRQHMITHGSETTRAAIARFKKADPPAILVSPVIMTGWDFPYDECRYQIVAKLPIPDSRGAVMKARSQADEDYIPYLTVQNLVQAVGRGMRAEDDWCETFILDDHIQWFVRRYRDFFPAWFLQAYSSTQLIPPPLSGTRSMSHG